MTNRIRIHPLIQAAAVGAGLALASSAFAAGDHYRNQQGSSAYQSGSVGATGSSRATDSAARAQERDSETGTGQTTGPQAGDTASGARGGSSGAASGATGATGSRSTDMDQRQYRSGSGSSAADSAESAQRRDSPTGTGQTTGAQAGESAGGARGGSGGSAGSMSR